MPRCSSSSSSDGQHVEVVDDVRSARTLPAGVLEQLGGRLPSQTGESGEQRLTGRVGQVPRSYPALCEPHHQAEVSQHGLYISNVFIYLFSSNKQTSQRREVFSEVTVILWVHLKIIRVTAAL